jgi:hypothetical protein
MIQEEMISTNLYYFLPTSPSMIFLNNGINYEIKIIWLIYMISLILISYFIGCAVVKRKEFLA